MESASDAETGPVDLAVIPHAGQATQHGPDEADHDGQRQGNDPTGCQYPFVDRYPGETVEVSQNLLLAAGMWKSAPSGPATSSARKSPTVWPLIRRSTSPMRKPWVSEW